MTEEKGSPAAAKKEAGKKQRRIPVYVFLIRWWAAGAVYFFIGWGTGLGSRDSVADLVFFLGACIGLFYSYVVNPVLKMVFDYGWHRPYGSSTFGQRMANRGKDLVLGVVSSILVFLVYRGINTAAVSILDLPEDQVFLPGEPLLYGLFFAIITTSIIWLARLAIRMSGKDRK